MAARQGRDAGTPGARRAAQQPGPAQRGHAQAHRDLAPAPPHRSAHQTGSPDPTPGHQTWATAEPFSSTEPRIPSTLDRIQLHHPILDQTSQRQLDVILRGAQTQERLQRPPQRHRLRRPLVTHLAQTLGQLLDRGRGVWRDAHRLRASSRRRRHLGRNGRRGQRNATPVLAAARGNHRHPRRQLCGGEIDRATGKSRPKGAGGGFLIE